MRSTIPLGRIGGVPVGMNLSVLFIVAILVFGLAFGRFPLTFPGLSTAAYLAAGVVAALLFMASLLAHEVAHALMAGRHGIGVSRITLWLLGGVAELRGEPKTPRADLQIAVVGPLTSLVAGLLFGVVAVLVRAAAGPSLAGDVFVYLAAVNVLLAVFNLVPAAPLDGGRVLRAALWWRWGDRGRAAVAAARAGRTFGYVLIALGFLQVAVGAGFGGIWLALIGLFLVNAASAEEQQAQLGAALRGVRVGEVMSRDPVVSRPDETVADLIEEVVLSRRLSTYPLVDERGGFAGLVTLNRIRQLPPEERATTLLADIACPPGEVPRSTPEEPLMDLLPRMTGCADGRAVVLDSGGHLVGLLTPTDISRAIQTSGLHTGAHAPRGADLAMPWRDHR